MIGGLLRFINGGSLITRREQVLESLEHTIKSIHDDTIPVLKEILELDAGKFKDDHILTRMYMAFKDKPKNNKEILEMVLSILEDFVSKERDIKKLIETSVAEIVTKNSPGTKDLAIMKLVADIMTIQQYTMDLIYFVVREKDTKGSVVTDLPEVMYNRVFKKAGYFTMYITCYYRNIDRHVKDLDRVADIVMDKNMTSKPTSMIDNLLKKEGKVLDIVDSDNFINSPIYHGRLAWTDRSFKKLEAVKTKKEAIELQLHALRINNDGKLGPREKKAIEYYEDSIAKLDYEIQKYHDSLNEGDDD